MDRGRSQAGKAPSRRLTRIACPARNSTSRNSRRPNELLHHLLASQPFSDYIKPIVTGVTVPHISPSQIGAFRFRLPPKEIQDAICQVLDTLDDQIENNRRRIALLEQIAQAVYREWFVFFRYPGHEDETDLHGNLTSRWQPSTLGDELEVLEAGSRPRGGIDANERGIASVGAENVLGLGKYRFEAEKYVTEAFYESMRRGRVHDGDVLLYKDGAHIGRHSLFRDGFPHWRLAINEHVFRLRARPPLTQSYLYFWIDSPETVEKIVALNSNAAQPGISQGKLASVPILVPPEDLVARWEHVVEPLLASLFSLARQEHVLRMTRDALLPRLVTGAIDVSHLDLDALLDETPA